MNTIRDLGMSPKFGAVRQARIAERIAQEREVDVGDLARDFGVSEETIRRDLKQLETESKLRRVHGGAIALDATHRSFVDRKNDDLVAKTAVARAAVPLVSEGSSIFVGGGTLTLAFARVAATDCPPARFVTNMIDAAQALSMNPAHEVVLTGGVLHREEPTLFGLEVLESVKESTFDLAFFGTTGIQLELGFLDHYKDTATLRRLMLKHARRTVVLVTDSCFGKPARHVTYGLDSADTLITDRLPPAPYQAALREAGVDVLAPTPEMFDR